MEISVDLKQVKEFVLSDSFTSYLVGETTDITIAIYIIQTLLDSIDKDMESMKDAN